MERRRQGYGGGRGELVVVVDCADLKRSAQFWTEVLGYVDTGGGSATYQSLLPQDGDGIEVLLQRVSDDKRGKNRVHLDLRTPDLEPEVTRLRGLGATSVTSSPIEEEGWSWHVLADPDGNEFCVIRPPSGYWDDEGLGAAWGAVERWNSHAAPTNKPTNTALTASTSTTDAPA